VDVFQEAELLRKVPFFGGLDSAKLKLLAFTSRALEVRFRRMPDAQKGERRRRLRDPDGEVEVVGERGRRIRHRRRGPQSAQGEMGVITNTPRGATVRAKTSCARCASPAMSSCG
jgi:hypothetical protein